ncbi:MAG: SDR family oxidoreductase [Hyphomicrobiales bacterium]
MPTPRSHDKYWRSQKVIVTAAGTGIGAEIARTYFDLGAKVFICDIDETRLSSVTGDRPDLGAAVCDVSRPRDVDSFVDLAVETMGGLTILVNNAGIAGPAKPLEDVTDDEWTQTFSINVAGQFYCARRAVPHLKANGGGSIVCMSSVAGKFGFALRSPYAASKWAVIGFMRSLSVELGQANIRVNAILPGIVSGQRNREVFAARAEARGISYEQMSDLALASVSLKTMIDPAEIADLIVYITSPSGRAITGQPLAICGGTEWIE